MSYHDDMKIAIACLLNLDEAAVDRQVQAMIRWNPGIDALAVVLELLANNPKTEIRLRVREFDYGISKHFVRFRQEHLCGQGRLAENDVLLHWYYNRIKFVLKRLLIDDEKALREFAFTKLAAVLREDEQEMRALANGIGDRFETVRNKVIPYIKRALEAQ
ncbi:MAG: hypothetical protein KDD69_13055 [Bdellovibrionales bacterium]|nr:hypothetical protein [Bdellovibrionales bacterium]